MVVVAAAAAAAAAAVVLKVAIERYKEKERFKEIGAYKGKQKKVTKTKRTLEHNDYNYGTEIHFELCFSSRLEELPLLELYFGLD